MPAIREGLLAANGDDARASAGSSVAKRGGGTLYLDGHELAEDPETCGFAGTRWSTSTCCAGPSTEASRWCLSLLGRGTTEARGGR